jgi:hypothetical protein
VEILEAEMLKKLFGMLNAEKYVKFYFLCVRASGVESVSKQTEMGVSLQFLMFKLNLMKA